jgi:ribosomal protein S21
MNKRQKQFESIQPGTPKSNRVVSVNGKPDISFALRKWKKMLKDNGTIEAVRQRQEFEKPNFTKRMQRERGKFLAQKATERYM